MLSPNVNESSVAILLSLITHHHFSNFYCLLQFVDGGGADVVHSTSTAYSNYVLSGNTTFGTQDIGRYDHCHGVLIIAAHANRILEMFERFIYYETSNDFSERRYLVRFDASQAEEFERFFESRTLRFVSDVLVLMEVDGGDIELYTHVYVGRGAANRPYLLGVWSSATQRLQGDESGIGVVGLFPNKLQNQQGKDLIVGGEVYLPITDPSNLKGPETRILVEYAERNNFTLIFDKSFNYLGEIRSNWTGTGYMGKLLQDKIDIISYAVYIQKDREDYGDFAYPNCEIRVTCLVPKPRLINKWMLIKIFAYDTWLLIALSMLTVMVSFKSLELYMKWTNEYGKQEIAQYLNVYRIYIAQPCVFYTQTQVERFIISVLLACAILIQTFFNSKLASYITVPNYVDDINTLDDLAQSDILWYSKFKDKGKLISGEMSEPIHTIHKKFHQLLDEDVASIKDEFYGYAVDESFTSHYFTIDDHFTIENLQNFKVMSEYIIRHQYTAFFLRRNSILLDGINDLCYKAAEHGLIKFWEKDSIADGNQRKIQEYLAISSKTETALVQLDIKLLTTIFAIWACGNFIGMLVFCYECYSHKYNLDVTKTEVQFVHWFAINRYIRK